ncbi:MAG: hypothetical protein ACLFS3_02195 [Candidatus Aenigmatarchaeota archaeon]
MPEEFKCDECGKTFDTKRGLHVHQSQVHKGKSKDKEEKKTEEKTEIKFDEVKLVKNPWKLATGLLAVLLVATMFLAFQGGAATDSGETLTKEKAAEKATDFINSEMLSQGTADVISTEENDELYEIKLDIQGQNYTSYMTKDGKLLFPQAVELSEASETDNQNQDQNDQDQGTTGNIVKKETPEAHAFVMSYCPYGLQFLKAYVPVMELLGDEADLNVNFVDYAMHGEKELDENLRMYCVNKEEPEKYTDYLRCSVKTEDENKEQCYEETGVDAEAIKSCVQETDEEYNITELYNDESTWSGGRYPQFPVESDLNQEYDVSGSPAFILNGENVNAGRSPEAIKDAICSSFENKPEECETELSTESESAGLGEIGAGSGPETDASC